MHLAYYSTKTLTPVRIGIHFLHSLLKNVRMSHEQRAVATAMGETYKEETLETWRAMVEAWQVDHSNPDPYAEPEACEFFYFIYANKTLTGLSSA